MWVLVGVVVSLFSTAWMATALLVDELGYNLWTVPFLVVMGISTAAVSLLAGRRWRRYTARRPNSKEYFTTR